MSEPQTIHDEANYRNLSEPFGSFDVANEAIQAFNEELRALRTKYALADVYSIIAGRAKTEDGEEGEFMVAVHNGDVTKAEAMTAWALGQESARRQERIAALLAKGISRRKTRK